MTAYPGEDERRRAEVLAAGIAANAPEVVTLADIDLRPALAHAIYAALRNQAGVRSPVAQLLVRPLRDLGRLLRAGTSALRNPVRTKVRGGAMVVLRARAHVRLLEPVAEELARVGGAPLHLLGVDRFALRGIDRVAGVASASVVQRQLIAKRLPALAAHALLVGRVLHSPAGTWSDGLGDDARAMHSVARAALPRLALAAAQLQTAVQAVQPMLVACYSESGIWGRLVPAVTQPLGIASIDLPHAEAADPWGSVGIGYDIVAVYGPRARQVMRLAGVPDQRIVETGAPRFDALLSSEPPVSHLRRIVFASQPSDFVRPALHPRLKGLALAATVAVAEAVAPSEVIVVPHPTESVAALDELLVGISSAAIVRIRVEDQQDLHTVLRGAWLLCTASSQSVFDAVVAGVPAITINVAGAEDPLGFVTEGISLGATDGATAAEAARRLLDPAQRVTVLNDARRAVERRLGPLDGRAAERMAGLMLRLMRDPARPPA